MVLRQVKDEAAGFCPQTSPAHRNLSVSTAQRESPARRKGSIGCRPAFELGPGPTTATSIEPVSRAGRRAEQLAGVLRAIIPRSRHLPVAVTTEHGA